MTASTEHFAPTARAVHVLYVGDGATDTVLDADSGFSVHRVPTVDAAVARARLLAVDCAVLTGAPGTTASHAAEALRRAAPDLPLVVVGDVRGAAPPADAVVAPCEAAPGSLAGAVAGAIARRHAGQRVRRDAWFAHEAIGALACGVLVHDDRHRLLAVNDAAMTLLGGAIEQHPDPAHDSGWRLVQADGSTVAELPSAAALRTAAPVGPRTVGVRTPGGGTTWLSLSARLIGLPAAEPCGVVTTVVSANGEHALHRALAHATAVLDTVGDAVVDLDEGGAVRGCNSAARALFGWLPGTTPTAPVVATPPADDGSGAGGTTVSTGRGPLAATVLPAPGSGGSTVVVRASDDEHAGCARLMTRLARSCDEGVVVISAEGTISAANDAAAALLGGPADAFVGSAVGDVLDLSDRPVNGTAETALRARLRSGTAEPLRATAYPGHDRHGAASSLVLAVPQQRSVGLADGPPSESLARCFARARDRGIVAVVAALTGPLDRRSGARVGAGLRAVAGAGCTVGAVAPDVFAVVVPDATLGTAADVAARVLAAIDAAGVAVPSTGARAGLTLTAGPSFDVACAAAVAAARAAPAGSRIALADATGTDASRLTRLVELRGHLSANRLDVQLQPIVDLDAYRIVGLEAFAAWRTSDGAAVDAAATAALADELGVARMLDAQLVRKTAEQLAALRHAGVLPGDCYGSVDVSGRSANAAGFPDLVRRVAAGAGLPRGALRVEVHESQLARHHTRLASAAGALRDAGAGVAVDHFGTGGLPLTATRELAGATLKIAAELVQRMTCSQRDLAVVRTIVGLARTFRSRTVALGVDTADLAQLARQVGCDAAQGSFWCAPLAAGEVGAWIAEHRRSHGAPTRTRPARGVAGLTADHGLSRLLTLYRGGASPATIAAALNAKGYRTPAGARWHAASVARALLPAPAPLAR